MRAAARDEGPANSAALPLSNAVITTQPGSAGSPGPTVNAGEEVDTVRFDRLGLRDLRATLFVATATTLFGLVRAGTDIPGLRHERPLAAAVLVLGMFACGAGARPDAFTDQGVATPFIAALRMLGAMVLVTGVVAVIAGVAAITFVLVTGELALWLGTTVRHLVTPLPAPTTAPTPRVKEMSS